MSGPQTGSVLEQLFDLSGKVAVVTGATGVLGGAMARVPVDATAFGHRRQPIMMNVAAVYPTPAVTPEHQAWVSDFVAALHPGPGAYVNFLGDEGPERVREAYPEPTWDRLTKIKARYDPTNLFRLNQNIPPAA